MLSFRLPRTSREDSSFFDSSGFFKAKEVFSDFAIALKNSLVSDLFSEVNRRLSGITHKSIFCSEFILKNPPTK